MLSLQDKEWRKFQFSEIFNIYTGAAVPAVSLHAGKEPRITASENNNGVAGLYSPSEHRNYRTLTNFVSVSFLGAVFYHPYTASLDMKIHAVTLKERKMTSGLGLFLAKTIRNTVAKFSYGNQLSSTDLPKQNLLLPIDSNSRPDWDYMESYIYERSSQLMRKYVEYAESTAPCNT
jgi:hypothetical protein